MKKLVSICILIGFFTACSKNEAILTGADRDTHNCIGSAGYTWSEAKNKCIRLWEEGKTLFPAQPTEGAVMAAYVVDGDGMVEAFLSGNSSAMLLTRQYVQGAPEWVSADGSGWKLVQDNSANWNLYQNGVLRYTSKKR